MNSIIEVYIGAFHLYNKVFYFREKYRDENRGRLEMVLEVKIAYLYIFSYRGTLL